MDTGWTSILNNGSLLLLKLMCKYALCDTGGHEMEKLDIVYVYKNICKSFITVLLYIINFD